MKTPDRNGNEACRRGLRVADGVVTARALEPGGVTVHYISVNGRGNRFVASPAGILDHPVIEFRDLNGVGVISAGEVERVPESVVRFYRVLSDDVVRRVAVIAGGHRMVARFHPGIVLRLHNVAVRTSGRVVGHVRVSLGVDEGVGAKADGDSEDYGRKETDCDRAMHRIAPIGRIRRKRLSIAVAKPRGKDL